MADEMIPRMREAVESVGRLLGEARGGFGYAVEYGLDHAAVVSGIGHSVTTHRAVYHNLFPFRDRTLGVFHGPSYNVCEQL